MKAKMDLMKSNSMRELADLPRGIKLIGYKIYKRKGNAKGKVETYKARLVAKG